jgi:hypothetical protein
MTDPKVRRSIAYAAVAWAIVFGAPHLWWGLGISFGFPGGRESYELFTSSAWRIVYDWVVVVMCVLAIVIVLTLQKPAEQVARRGIPLVLCWFASGILLFRAVAGFIFDGTSDLLWNPVFFTGGMLMGAVARMARTPRMARKDTATA